MYPSLAAESPEIVSPVRENSTRLRACELGIVSFVALATPIANSTYLAIYGASASPRSANFRYLSMILHEISSLLVLWYVLRRSGRSFSTLGLRLSIKGFFTGLGLFLLSMIAAYTTWFALQFGHKYLFGSFFAAKSLLNMFPAASWACLVPLTLLNPFFEEIIVRGYLMTEVSALTGSVFLATLMSVVLQTSYHIYQGWSSAACLAAIFAVLSTYYARKQKLFPPIVAHLIADLVMLTRIR